jgi:hypothetical protein
MAHIGEVVMVCSIPRARPLPPGLSLSLCAAARTLLDLPFVHCRPPSC